MKLEDIGVMLNNSVRIVHNSWGLGDEYGLGRLEMELKAVNNLLAIAEAAKEVLGQFSEVQGCTLEKLKKRLEELEEE